MVARSTSPVAGLGAARGRLWQQPGPGSYLLLLRLARPTSLTVGRLGRLALAAGWYVYVGSALGGLGPRLWRHRRRAKPRHWHVDALREATSLVAIAARLGPERIECQVAARLAERPDARLAAARFGASDCRCPGHLIAFGQPPDLALDPAWRVEWLRPGYGPGDGSPAAPIGGTVRR